MSTERPSLNKKLQAQKHSLIGRFYDVFGLLEHTDKLQFNFNEGTTLLRHDQLGGETKEEIEENFDFATENFFDALVWKNLLQLYISKINHDLGEAVHIIKYGNGTFGVMVSNLDALNEILTKDVLTQVYYNYIKLMSQDALLDDTEIDALEKTLLDLKTSSGFFPPEKSYKLRQELLVQLRSSLDAKAKQLQQMRQEIQSIQAPLARKEEQLKKLQEDTKKMLAEIDAKKLQLRQRESIEKTILDLRVTKIEAATPALQRNHTTKLSVADYDKELVKQEQELKKLPTAAEIEQWIEIAEALVAPRQKAAAEQAAAMLHERTRAHNHIVELEIRIKEYQTKLDLQEQRFAIVKSQLHASDEQKEKDRKREAKHSRKNASTFFAPAAKLVPKGHTRKNASIFYAPAKEDEDDTTPDITTEAASSTSKTGATLEAAMAQLSIVEAASSSSTTAAPLEAAMAQLSIVEAASSAPKTEATVEASSASSQSRGYRS